MAAIAPRHATRLPAVRARYMQTFASHVDRLPRADRDSVRAAVPPGTWESIESAGLLGWLPLSTNIACTRAVAGSLGPEGTHRFFHGLLLDTSESPLLSGLVRSVLRVAVRDPGLYLPWVSKGFELMFRDAGRWVVSERAPGTAVLEVRGLPPEALVDSIWPDSVASSFSALLDLVQLKGSASVRSIDVDEGTITLRVRWNER